jgi:hypothetical protein
LYARFADWPDAIRAKQAHALAELGQFDQAAHAIAGIGDAEQRGVATAHLLYRKGDWQTLAGLESRGTQQRKWQLLGLARQNLETAGKELATQVRPGSADVAELRVLVRYAARGEPEADMQRFARQLIEEVDKRVLRLASLTETALRERRANHAAFLIQRMQELDAQAKPLESLRKRLAELTNARQIATTN